MRRGFSRIVGAFGGILVLLSAPAAHAVPLPDSFGAGLYLDLNVFGEETLVIDDDASVGGLNFSSATGAIDSPTTIDRVAGGASFSGGSGLPSLGVLVRAPTAGSEASATGEARAFGFNTFQPLSEGSLTIRGSVTGSTAGVTSESGFRMTAGITVFNGGPFRSSIGGVFDPPPADFSFSNLDLTESTFGKIDDTFIEVFVGDLAGLGGDFSFDLELTFDVPTTDTGGGDEGGGETIINDVTVLFELFVETSESTVDVLNTFDGVFVDPVTGEQIIVPSVGVPQTAAIPEPSALGLIAASFGFLGWRARRRR